MLLVLDSSTYALLFVFRQNFGMFNLSDLNINSNLLGNIT